MNAPQSIDKLEAILNRQAQNAGELLALLAEEKEAMSTTDVEKLLSLSFKKEQRLRAMTDLDRALQAAIKVVAGNPENKTPRISDLKPFLSSSTFNAIDEMKKKLSEMRKEILTRTTFNRKLAEEMQLFIKDAMSLITGFHGLPATYGIGGKSVKGGGMAPSLISREV